MIHTFITLLGTTDEPVKVNVAHIIAYHRFNKTSTRVHLSDGTDVFVDETPEQIDAMIREAYGRLNFG